MGQKVLNAASMKVRNRRKIIEYLRTAPLSRAELSRKTGLTRAGISVIADELLSEGVLMEGNPIMGRVGRASVELTLNAEYCYAIGIDLARDYCCIGIGDLGGNIRQICKLEGQQETAGEIVDKLLEMVSYLQRQEGCMPVPGSGSKRFIGIGITAPGPLDVKHGRILNPPNFEKWNHVDIVSHFLEKCQCPVLLENNAKAWALAEKYYGIGSRYQNYIELIVDTGVGGGIVFDGKLYQGSSFLGGDFGHMCIDIHGPRCSCGNYGCAEMYASLPNIERYAKEKLGEVVTWRQIVDRAAAGDAGMQDIVDREARYLSVIITNATNIMDTQAVIMASEINYKSEYLLPLVQKYVNCQFIGREMKEIEIVASSMEKNNRVLSGINLVIENGI